MLTRQARRHSWQHLLCTGIATRPCITNHVQSSAASHRARDVRREQALLYGMASVFASVFPKPTFAAPTPEVTPEIGSLQSAGQPFGVLTRSHGAVEEPVQVSRAWSLAINWLKALLDGHGSYLDQQHEQAFTLLLRREQEELHLRTWYLDAVTTAFAAVRNQYIAMTLPWLDGRGQLNTTVADSIQIIELELDRCLSISSCYDGPSEQLQVWLHRMADLAKTKWFALTNALSFRNKIKQAMVDGFCAAMSTSDHEDKITQCWQHDECHCPINLVSIPLQHLRSVGLGGAFAESALADALQRYLQGPATQKTCFRVDWRRRASSVPRLRSWVATRVAPMATAALKQLTDDVAFDEQRVADLADAAVDGLGYSRVENIFDYIKAWPHSEGAVDDIKAFLGNEELAKKIYVCTACDEQLQRRLLHIGASTSDILAAYVNLIHVFERLDARGVLLEKVSPILRHYLRTRSDAANVIAHSLLAEPSPDKNATYICSSIAIELQNAVHSQAQRTTTLDYDDMEWIPEPIDAGPNHRNAKAKDVLTHIFSLYDPDEFIKEIESVMAEQLLKGQDSEIVRETRLLEVLKSRLDTTKLQNLEIMLKDMRDSVTFETRLDDVMSTAVPTPKEIQAAIPAQGISVGELYARFAKRMRRTQFHAVLKLVAIKRNEMLFPKRGRLPVESEGVVRRHDPGFQVRVLSSSAWPQMRTDSFALPGSVAQYLLKAEARFGALSGQRRLEWRAALSTISVTLELEDRTITEQDIPAWYGTVIHAFGSDVQQDPSLTASELSEVLRMDQGLVHDALSFWLRKQVLFVPSPGKYTVLERLDMDVVDTEPSVLQTETFTALKSQDAVLREHATMFEAFIANMLRNAGPKEVGGMMGITNMMKMVLPSFTYGDDEVQWLLSQMLGRGEVDRDGESWKIASS